MSNHGFLYLCVLLIFAFDANTVFVQGDCNIELPSGGPSKMPLITDTNGKYIFPEKKRGDRVLHLKANQRIRLSCPGYGNHGYNVPDQVFEVECLRGETFQAGTKTFSFRELGCAQDRVSETRPNGWCGDRSQYRQFSIGWKIGDEWREEVAVCHDTEVSGTKYTRHIIHGDGVDSRNVDSQQPVFREATHYTEVPVGRSYQPRSQVRMMEKLLGSQVLAQRELKPNEGQFLATAQLSPENDFSYKIQQDATFFYINAAPQWHSINMGNWHSLEAALRQKASDLNTNFEVITGTYGVQEMRNNDNKDVDVYLYEKSNGEKYVPVPKYFWKIYRDMNSNDSLAFILINSLSPDRNDKQKKLCRDVCTESRQVKFNVDWIDRNSNKGYMYCCDVRNLREEIPYIPDFSGTESIPRATGLLLLSIMLAILYR